MLPNKEEQQRQVRTRYHQKSADASRTSTTARAQRSQTASAASASAAATPHSRLGSAGADGLRFFGPPSPVLVRNTTATEHSTEPPGAVAVPGPGAQAAGGS